MDNKFLLDTIAILSFAIAVENLGENEKQSKLLKDTLDNQDNVYLKHIVKLLETSIEQNELIIKQNEQLLGRR